MWKLIYVLYPPILRILEKIKIHSFRQNFFVGKLDASASIEDVKSFLQSQNYENSILAWKDPGEVLSMRKIHNTIFQYHIRIFDDGEIRAHFEYSSEGNPIGHVLESIFKPETEYFTVLLQNYLEKQ